MLQVTQFLLKHFIRWIHHIRSNMHGLKGLQAYSGTCGQAFVDSPGFPAELQGGFIKARYKPTNRIEIHRWIENDFGFNEQYVSDLIFSTNLSFIPVDLHFGPRGDLFVVDWYNPGEGTCAILVAGFPS
jgi:hypothetical protein